MNYQEYDYETATDAPAWATPSDAKILPLTPNPVIAVNSNPPTAYAANNTPTMSEMLVLGSMVHSIQQSQTQQLYLMRQMDTRLTQIENSARVNIVAPNNSFERATWWALWGLLMLILGGALTIVVMLILMNIEFR